MIGVPITFSYGAIVTVIITTTTCNYYIALAVTTTIFSSSQVNSSWRINSKGRIMWRITQIKIKRTTTIIHQDIDCRCSHSYISTFTKINNVIPSTLWNVLILNNITNFSTSHSYISTLTNNEAMIIFVTLFHDVVVNTIIRIHG